jgi:probable HAF family extracellular repeat protein
MTGLGNLPDGGFASSATAVSADGTVVVGVGHQSLSFDHQVFRWVSNSGMTLLGNTPTGATPIGVAGISADGTVVTGLAMNDSATYSPGFRWSVTQGMQELGFLPGATFARANAISADGRVIVGGANADRDSWAFRWTQEEGMQSLGDLPSNLRDGHAVEATAVSADGRIILGRIYEAYYLGGEVAPDSQMPALLNEAQTTTDLTDGAFIWTAATGMRNLKDVLINDYGLDLTGWTLDDVTGISADGRVIVGNGYDPQGQVEGWVATVPEPGVSVLLVMGGLLAFRARRASRCNLRLRRDSDA